jgi:hypothetical protein
MLRQKFPNLSELLQDKTELFNGGFVSDDGTKLLYKMPVLTFGHHVGDNWIVVEEGVLGYIISFQSKVGSNLMVKTTSKKEYYNDLQITDWDVVLNEILSAHIVKPEYIDFTVGKVGKKMERQLTGQNSGCMVFFVAGVTITLLTYILS